MGGFAWVTLATNDSYSLGALVLAHSLRNVHTQHDLAVLITPGVTESMREKLASVFTLVQEVNLLDSKDEENLINLQRPELGITFTKLHCWRLTQYEKCVFIDADTLVVKNCDELFEREELSAAPDVGWPDCFNSGVFVFRPSQETFVSLMTFAANKGSFDGADQGLLNMYFNDWAHKDISKHLPFIYNMSSTATYSYAPAFKQYGENVRIIHFIGATKPWLLHFDTVTGIVQPPLGCDHLQPLLQIWWNIFCDNIHPQLTDAMGGLAGALSKLTMGECRTNEQQAIEDHMRKQNWEQGHVDFMGRDSFDNILKKINETLLAVPETKISHSKKIEEPQESLREERNNEAKATIVEGESAIIVLAGDQAESRVIRDSSENYCPKISSLIVTIPIISKKEQDTESSSTAKSNETDIIDPEKISNLIQGSMKPMIETVIQHSLDFKINEQKIMTALEVPANLISVSKQTKTFISEPAKEIKVYQENVHNIDKVSTQKHISENIPEVSLNSSILITSELPDFIAAKSDIKSVPIAASDVSEASSEYSVPIQVAESVLQAEPNESESEDSRSAIESVVSSTTSQVQKSTVDLAETLFEYIPIALAQSHLIDDNNKSLQFQVENISIPLVIDTDLQLQNVEQENEILKSKNKEVQIEFQPEEVLSGSETKMTSLNVSEETSEIPVAQKTKLVVKLPQVKQNEEVASETQEQILPTLFIADTNTTDCPLRPIRSKDFKIPATPIITEPTPPTSPPLKIDSTEIIQEKIQGQVSLNTMVYAERENLEEIAAEPEQLDLQKIQAKVLTETLLKTEEDAQATKQAEKKILKKIVKKSSAESDTPSSPESESSSQKIGKKVVKKKEKKLVSSEETQDNSNTNKQKRVVKPLKKAMKTFSSTNLETKKNVVETPLSITSPEIPIPPKRKFKSTSNTEMIAKKSDK